MEARDRRSVGSDIASTAGKQTQAPFGFMFKDPPSYGPPDELLQQLAAQMGEPTGAALENPDILSGEVFLGQFIDHDLAPAGRQVGKPRPAVR